MNYLGMVELMIMIAYSLSSTSVYDIQRHTHMYLLLLLFSEKRLPTTLGRDVCINSRNPKMQNAARKTQQNKRGLSRQKE
ncbi:hypothetical protein ACN42_g7844 [Penicillium freii]|uniref:Secreted protein n=1 Tax=Penicillium freii TaxID=48697 RepID=A0A101MEU0_PENFR|nr:hypothetical protein ACN42_g7844 [Penicillium freii]